MTRNEIGVLAAGLSDMRERAAVTETKLDALEKSVTAISDKIDLMIAGQADGKKDRADLRAAIDTVQADVKAMRPDIETVRDAKRVLKVSAWIAGGVSAMITTAWAAWSWVIQNITWR
jgi:peptidoglycan hydrolase CwlO-like protein